MAARSTRHGIGRLGQSRLLGESALVFVATLASNAMVFGGLVLASRVLGPAPYGVVAAMLGVVIVLTIPSLALQTLVAREVAGALAAGEGPAAVALTHRRRSRQAALVGVAIAAVTVALAPLVASPLGLGSPWPVAFTGAAALPILLMAESRGVQQGRQQFRALGMNLGVEGATRLAATAVALAIGSGATGVTAAPALGTGVAAILALASARDLPTPSGAIPRLAWAGISFVFFAGFAAITNVDVVVANSVLEDVPSGEYGAAALYGRVVLLAPMAVGIVLLPKVIQVSQAGRPTLRLLGLALAAVAATSGVLALIGIIAPELIRIASVGGGFAGADDVIRIYGIAMVCFAALQVVGLYNIALSRPVTAWACVAAAPLQIAALLLVPARGTALALVMIATAGCLLAIAIGEARRTVGQVTPVGAP